MRSASRTNPRGGQGPGHDVAVRIAGAVGLDEWTDICAGIDLLIADGVADPDRLGIDGWSPMPLSAEIGTTQDRGGGEGGHDG